MESFSTVHVALTGGFKESVISAVISKVPSFRVLKSSKAEYHVHEHVG
jgi:hypothetical protein